MTDNYIDTAKENINNSIISGLEKIMQVFRVLLWETAKRDNISPLQIQFMEFINRSVYQLCTVSNISKEFDLKKSTVSESVKNLEDKGFLCKTKNPEDGRVYYLSLTNKGRNIIDSLSGFFSAINMELDQIDIQERLIVSKFLMELIGLFHKKGLIQTAKVCINCANFQKDRNIGSLKPHYCSYARINIGDEDIHYNCKYYKE